MQQPPSVSLQKCNFCWYPFYHRRTKAEARERLPNGCYSTASVHNRDEHPNQTSTQGSPLKLVTYFELGGIKQWLIEGSYAADLGNSKRD